MSKESRKTKQQEKLIIRRAEKIEKHTINTVEGLVKILEKYPPIARVYVDVYGDVIIHQGQKELACINLNGI